MANYHVSSSGSNTAPYDTWAKAATSLFTATAAAAAGDTIYVDSAFTQSVSTTAMAFAGTASTPNKLFVCTHSGASGMDAVATGAVITYTGNGGSVTGSAFIYGLTIDCTYAASAVFYLGDTTSSVVTFDHCTFIWTGAGNSYWSVGSGSTSGSAVRFESCSFKMASTNQRLNINCHCTILGGSWLSGGTSPTGIFLTAANSRGSSLFVSGFDFSNLSSSVNLIQSANGGNYSARFVYCKMPSSWSGSPNAIASTYPAAWTTELIACGNGSGVPYDYYSLGFAGSVVDETTIVLAASDGTTTFSRKMNSAATYPNYPGLALRGPPMIGWFNGTGSSKTATVEFVHDTNVAAGQGAGTSYAFQDDEVWLELEYFGTSGQPLGSAVSSRKVLGASAADITSSSASWTTTGLTTPVKQKLSASFTPQFAGYVIGRVCVAKPSKTLYYDPVLTVA